MNRRSRPKTDSRIQIINAEPARTAIRVRDTGLHTNPVANAQMFYLASSFDDRACSFVSQHHRRLYYEGPNLPEFVVMDIAAADPDRVNCDLHIMRTDCNR